MENDELEQRRLAYNTAVDEWVASIREEEGLAKIDHSMLKDEAWDQAHFKEQDAQKKAEASRDAYKDALRKVLYNF